MKLLILVLLFTIHAQANMPIMKCNIIEKNIHESPTPQLHISTTNIYIEHLDGSREILMDQQRACGNKINIGTKLVQHSFEESEPYLRSPTYKGTSRIINMMSGEVEILQYSFIPWYRFGGPNLGSFNCGPWQQGVIHYLLSHCEVVS